MEEIKILIKNILNDPDKKSSYFLSYYDHWLSEDEAEAAFSIGNYDNYVKGLQIEAQIVKFFLSLKGRYEILWFDQDDDSIGIFLNEGEFIEFIVEGLRESIKFVLLIRPLEILFVSAFDRDVAIYSLNDNEQELMQIVKQNNLNLLA